MNETTVAALLEEMKAASKAHSAAADLSRSYGPMDAEEYADHCAVVTRDFPKLAPFADGRTYQEYMAWSRELRDAKEVARRAHLEAADRFLEANAQLPEEARVRFVREAKRYAVPY